MLIFSSPIDRFHQKGFIFPLFDYGSSYLVEDVVALFSLAAGSVQIWGGVIGALGLEEGNGGADFYASFYNDHVRGNGVSAK